MEIKEAIESLENDQRRNYTQKESNLYKAQGLGLEALKRIQKGRAVLKYPFADRPLPGETIKPVHDSRRLDPRYPCMLFKPGPLPGENVGP